VTSAFEKFSWSTLGRPREGLSTFGLAPSPLPNRAPCRGSWTRSSLVRIVTGRDAADIAFAAVTTGIADLVQVEVTAIADPILPTDEPSEIMVLA